MTCSICGRSTNNEEAHFCEYCGNSYRDHKPIIVEALPRTVSNASGEKPISFSNWLASYGIVFSSIFIPVIGFILSAAYLFYLSFASNIPISKRNWARVTLIFYGIFYFLFVAFVFRFITIMVDNKEFHNYINEIMQQLKSKR